MSHAERLHYGIQEVFNTYEKHQRANLKAMTSQVTKLKKTMAKQFSQVEQAIVGFTSSYVDQAVHKRLTNTNTGATTTITGNSNNGGGSATTTEGVSIVKLIQQYDETMEDMCKSFQVTSPVIAVVGGPRKLRHIKPEDQQSCTGQNLARVAKQRVDMLEYFKKAVAMPYKRTKERLQEAGKWKEPEDGVPVGVGSRKLKPGQEVSPLEPAIKTMLQEIETLKHQVKLARETPSVQQTLFTGFQGSNTGGTRKSVGSPRRVRNDTGGEGIADDEYPDRAATTSPNRVMSQLKGPGGSTTLHHVPDTHGLFLEGNRRGTVGSRGGEKSSKTVLPLLRRGFGEAKGLRKTAELEKQKDLRRFHGVGAGGTSTILREAPPEEAPQVDFEDFALEVKTAMRHKSRNTVDKVQRFLTQVQNEADPMWRAATKQGEDNSADLVKMLQPTTRNTIGTLNSSSQANVNREDQLKDHAVNRMMEKRLKKSLVGNF